VIDDALNPLNLNNSAVGPKTHCLKVLSGFHWCVLGKLSTLAIFGDQNRAIGMLSPFQAPADLFGFEQVFPHQFIASVVCDRVSRHPV
jgi:hypothetical protein